MPPAMSKDIIRGKLTAKSPITAKTTNGSTVAALIKTPRESFSFKAARQI